MSKQISFTDIKDGDRQAFRAVFERYYVRLHRFVWGYVHSKTAAEGIVQDLFTTLWEKKDNIEIEHSIKAYLFRAARNKSIDWLRHKKVEDEWREEKRQINQHREQPDMSKRLHDKQMLTEVKQAISDMPERRREVFMLSRYEDMTYKEIADLLDISPSTVETHMSKALDELRTKFLPLLSMLSCTLL